MRFMGPPGMFSNKIHYKEKPGQENKKRTKIRPFHKFRYSLLSFFISIIYLFATMGKRRFIPFVFSACVLLAGAAQAQQNDGPTVRLDAQTIEGKIKKPQAALIALEKRPDFKPMALTDVQIKRDILREIDPVVFENRIYEKPFPVTEK
jgi:hypothetical protein